MAAILSRPQILFDDIEFQSVRKNGWLLSTTGNYMFLVNSSIAFSLLVHHHITKRKKGLFNANVLKSNTSVLWHSCQTRLALNHSKIEAYIYRINHWGRDQMSSIVQTFSYPRYCMKPALYLLIYSLPQSICKKYTMKPNWWTVTTLGIYYRVWTNLIKYFHANTR